MKSSVTNHLPHSLSVAPGAFHFKQILTDYKHLLCFKLGPLLLGHVKQERVGLKCKESKKKLHVSELQTLHSPDSFVTSLSPALSSQHVDLYKLSLNPSSSSKQTLSMVTCYSSYSMSIDMQIVSWQWRRRKAFPAVFVAVIRGRLSGHSDLELCAGAFVAIKFNVYRVGDVGRLVSRSTTLIHTEMSQQPFDGFYELLICCILTLVVP